MSVTRFETVAEAEREDVTAAADAATGSAGSR